MILFAVIMGLSLSCSKPNTTAATLFNVVVDTPGPAIAIDSFPLKVGNTWTYQVVKLGGSLDTQTITVASDTAINGMRAAVVTSSFLSGTTTKACYTNNNGSLSLVALIYAVDSFAFLDTPLKVVSFPNTTGRSWTRSAIFPGGVNVLTGDVNACPYNAQWASFDKVTTPLGIFNCSKLIDTSGYCAFGKYQYYATKGLIKEVEIAAAGAQGKIAYYIASSATLISVNF